MYYAEDIPFENLTTEDKLQIVLAQIHYLYIATNHDFLSFDMKLGNTVCTKITSSESKFEKDRMFRAKNGLSLGFAIDFGANIKFPLEPDKEGEVKFGRTYSTICPWAEMELCQLLKSKRNTNFEEFFYDLVCKPIMPEHENYDSLTQVKQFVYCCYSELCALFVVVLEMHGMANIARSWQYYNSIRGIPENPIDVLLAFNKEDADMARHIDEVKKYYQTLFEKTDTVWSTLPPFDKEVNTFENHIAVACCRRVIVQAMAVGDLEHNLGGLAQEIAKKILEYSKLIDNNFDSSNDLFAKLLGNDSSFQAAKHIYMQTLSEWLQN